MKKADLKTLVDKLISDELTDKITEECKRLMNSGGIDIDQFEDESYVPARIILTVALRNVANRVSPVSQEYKSIIKNLEHF